MRSLTDLEAIGKLRLEHGNCLTIVDGTFASPFNQQPLAIPGVDISLHSATKYLGGHSDITAGCIAVNDDDLMLRIGETQKVVGGMLSAFDSFLLSRGIKTLGTRMR